MKNIAGNLFLRNLNQMKSILNIGEFKFGKDSEDYKYFKKQVMDIVYGNLQDLFRTLEQNKEIEKCECKANLRHGYSKCPDCSGAGYRDA